jgi:hypothetical protein
MNQPFNYCYWLKWKMCCGSNTLGWFRGLRIADIPPSILVSSEPTETADLLAMPVCPCRWLRAKRNTVQLSSLCYCLMKAFLCGNLEAVRTALKEMRRKRKVRLLATPGSAGATPSRHHASQFVLNFPEKFPAILISPPSLYH